METIEATTPSTTYTLKLNEQELKLILQKLQQHPTPLTIELIQQRHTQEMLVEYLYEQLHP